LKFKLSHYSAVIYGLLIYSFLYVPILILVAFSFNDSKLNAVWSGFTLEWYGKLWTNSSVLDAAKITLIVAIISTIAATMIGTLVSVGMYKYHFKGKKALDSALYIPLVMSEIVMGIAFLAFFSMAKIPLGVLTLIIAHITFCIPFVVVVVRARLQGYDRSIEEAAMDLGASEWQTFRLITLPVISPAIVASALLAFTISLDDVIISFFVAGPGSTTLPLQIFSMVRYGVTPEINALSTIMLIFTLVLVVTAEKLRIKKN
jgi:spermidine/putrescine transport system permease protein